MKNLQKRVIDPSSSHKNTQFEKKNHLKWSPGSQDIEVLKSANFSGFFPRMAARIFFIYVEFGGRIFPNKLHICIPLTISPNFKKKIIKTESGK
jgi:hypothetical protein